jgi:hypothetical protein
MHLSSTKVAAPGPVSPSFPLHLRVWGPEPPGGRRFRASVVDVRVTTDPLMEFDYKLKMSLVSPAAYDVFQDALPGLFADAVPTNVSTVLDGFNHKVRKQYGHLKRVPHVRFELVEKTVGEIAGAMGRFVVSLPPYTSLYTDAFGLFETLGFNPPALKKFDGISLMNHVGPVVAIWGFENESVDVVEQLGEPMSAYGEAMEELYHGFAEDKAVTDPKLELRVLREPVTLALEHKSPLTKLHVAEALSTVLDDGLRVLSLDESFLSVMPAGRFLVVRSREVEEDVSFSRVVVELSPTLARFLQVESVMEFPLHESKSYQLEPKDENDFLDEHYPVYLVPEGTGNGTDWSYVEGRGFTSVMAVMKSPGEIMGPGTLVYGDRDALKLTFLDRSFNPIMTMDPLTVYLTLELQSLF